jgi:hypothetical protein
MKNDNYFDSFETQVVFEQSTIIESLEEVKQAVKLKIIDNKNFFGFSEYMAYTKHIESIKKELLKLKTMPVVKDVLAINAKFPVKYPCLAKLNKN